MRQAMMWMCLLWAMSVGSAIAAQDFSYKSCTDLARSKPEESLQQAEEAIRKANSPSGYHCRAISLFAMKRYEEAAKALETLSFVVTDKNLILWANTLRQAAKAWQLSEDNAKAIIALSKAIGRTTEAAYSQPAIAQITAELLLDRSTLYREGKRNLFALQDLDHAVALASNLEKLRFARADLLMEMNENILAKADLQQILATSPDNAQAKLLIKKMK